MSSPALSRRALLGLGLSRLTPAPPSPSPPAPAPRWTWDPSPWAPAAEALRAHAAPRPDERVLLHGFAGDGAFDGDLADRPALGEPFDVVLSVGGPQTTPRGFAALDALLGLARPGGRVGFCVWSGGVVQQLLKAGAPRVPGLAPVWTWGRDERLRQDLDRHAEDVRFDTVVVELRAAAVPALLDLLVAGVPALRAPEPPLAGVLERHVRDEGGAVAVSVPLLTVLAVKR